MDYKLSDRIRNLYLSGTSNKQIAKYLNLDIETVKRYTDF